MFKSILNSTVVAVLLAGGLTVARGQNPTPLVTRSVDQLIAVLKSDAPLKDKADACRELAVIGTKDAVPALVALLPDEQLSHMARYGLETLPDPAVDTALRQALNEITRPFRGSKFATNASNTRLLIGVIASIGVRRDIQAIGSLSSLLSDADVSVARAAAGALGQMGTITAAKALQEAWANLPAPKHLALCEGLLRCAEALVAKGLRPEALAIYDILRSAQAPPQVRAGALRGAILIRQSEGLPLLREALGSDDFVLVAAAVRIAQELSEPGVTQVLSSWLMAKDFSADKKILVIQTLGQRADPAARYALSEAVRSGPPQARMAALRALAQIGQPFVVPELVKAMADPDGEIAKIALESLASVPGTEAEAAVVSMLNSGTTARRLTGLELVGRRRMTACLPDLVKAAESSDAEIRPVALKRLGELSGPAELPTLLALLKDLNTSPDLDAAEQAIIAVSARIEKPEASVEKVIGQLSLAQPAQKGVLLRVLAARGGAEALKAVRAAVDDSNAQVHAAAIRALGAWKTVDAAPELLVLAKAASNQTDRLLCLRGYLDWASHPDLSVGQRLTMCQQAAGLLQKPEEKKLLMAALGSVEAFESLVIIAPYFEDADAKEEAVAATVTIADRLLRRDRTGQTAPKLIAPLQKAAHSTANANMAERIQALLKTAQAKVNAK